MSISYAQSTRELIDFIDNFGSVSIAATNTQNEAKYTNYLSTNILNLNPIEGIYDVHQDLSMIIQGKHANELSDGKVVIMRMDGNKDESSFIVLPFSGNLSFDGRDYFERLGETSIYKFNQIGNDYTLNERIALTNLFGFTLSITLTPEVFSAMGLDPKVCAGVDNYSFVKVFPTKSIYEGIARDTDQPEAWSGTGWAIGNGYLVTNNHVVEGARSITVKGVGGDFNVGYSAEVVATDIINDIAILKIKDSRFSGFGNIPYSVSSRMADVGEDVFVLGYPLGQLLGDEIKLTTGIINSRTGAGEYQNCYQIQAPITNGNSGGPVFDSKGNVIGIVVAGLNKELNLAENVGYAIKTSYLKILIESDGLNITFPSNNTISTLSRPEKVKRVKNFVYYLECSK